MVFGLDCDWTRKIIYYVMYLGKYFKTNLRKDKSLAWRTSTGGKELRKYYDLPK